MDIINLMNKRTTQIQKEIKGLRARLALLNPDTKDYKYLLDEIKIREKELRNIAEAKAGMKMN